MGEDIHIIPINDLRDHEENEQCWCRPMEVFDGDEAVWCHNSMDRREHTIEQGRVH